MKPGYRQTLDFATDGHFSFVKIKETELGEDTDEQVRENIRKGVKELKPVLEGKKKSRPAKDFLKDLNPNIL